MRRGAWILAALALAGCAVSPYVPEITGRAVDAQQVRDWSARGRLALAVGSDGGSGSFVWTQRGDVAQVRVQGPLGVGALDIVTDGEALTVSDAAGQRLDADAAREQLRQRLGADLPLAQMRYWLLGLAAPGEPARLEAQDGRPRSLEQAGWTVRYEAVSAIQGWDVPQRLTASRESARVRLIVDEWQLPPAGPGASP